MENRDCAGFDAPDMPGKRREIGAAHVRQRLAELAPVEDLSKFVV